jgi:hypothetical protein
MVLQQQGAAARGLTGPPRDTTHRVAAGLELGPPRLELPNDILNLRTRRGGGEGQWRAVTWWHPRMASESGRRPAHCVTLPCCRYALMRGVCVCVCTKSPVQAHQCRTTCTTQSACVCGCSQKVRQSGSCCVRVSIKPKQPPPGHPPVVLLGCRQQRGAPVAERLLPLALPGVGGCGLWVGERERALNAASHPKRAW